MLSVQDRERLVEAVESGRSLTEVAMDFGTTRATVRRWVVRHRAGESLEDQPRCGAPALLDADDLNVLGELVADEPSASLEQFSNALEARTGKVASTITIRRGLKKLGLRKVRPRVVHEDAAAPPDIGRYKNHHRRQPEEGRYPSSLTDHEWELLKPEFEPEGPRGRGRPRLHQPRDLLDAIFYVIRTGCPWRYLPGDFPPWETVYSAFRAWSEKGSFERMHQVMATEWRVREGRAPEPSAGIIDSQTAKTTEKGGLEVTTVPSG